MESLHAQKYQKLINEYTKTKAQLTIVKNALLEEQALTTQLKNENKMLILETKKTEQQNELLFSHNQRLSKRIEILQNDTKINNNKKSKNIQYETIEVMSQELERKVLENADLYDTCQNLKQEKDILQNNLIAILKQNNTLKESVSFEQLQIEQLIDEQNKTNEKVKTDEDFEKISEYKIMKSNLIMNLAHNIMIQKWLSEDKKKNWSFKSFHEETQKYLTKLLILLNNLYSKICNEINLEKTNPTIFIEYQEFDKTISINQQQENFTKTNFYQFNTLSIIYAKTCQFINENVSDFPKKEFEKICNSMKEFLDILIDTMEYEEKYKKNSKWRIISMSVIVLSSWFKELYDLYKKKNSYSEIIEAQKNIAKYALLMVEPTCTDFSSQKLSSLYTSTLSEVDKLINNNNITIEKNDILQKKLDEANEIIKQIPPPKEYQEVETSTEDLQPVLTNKSVQVENLITFKDNQTQTNEKYVLETLIKNPLESHINYLNKKLQTADSTVERLYIKYLNQQNIINQYKNELMQKEKELKEIQSRVENTTLNTTEKNNNPVDLNNNENGNGNDIKEESNENTNNNDTEQIKNENIENDSTNLDTNTANNNENGFASNQELENNKSDENKNEDINTSESINENVDLSENKNDNINTSENNNENVDSAENKNDNINTSENIENVDSSENNNNKNEEDIKNVDDNKADPANLNNTPLETIIQNETNEENNEQNEQNEIEKIQKDNKDESNKNESEDLKETEQEKNDNDKTNNEMNNNSDENKEKNESDQNIEVETKEESNNQHNDDNNPQ